MESSILTALSIGYLVPPMLQRPIHFHTHSRFRHVINLVSSDVGMVSLLGSESGNVPRAIRLNLPRDWDWDRCRGDGGVTWSDGVLRGHGWSVDTRSTPIWHPGTDTCDARSIPDASLIGVLAHALGMHVQEQLWSPDPVWLARDVLSATSSMDDSQVRALIGSGPGLTPAGDDYLLGYLAALWPWRKHTALASHLQHVQTLIKTHIGCTTDISRFYLDQAVEGHFSEPVHGLMGAVIRKAPCNEALASARDVMNYGASSGADAMAGLIR